MDRISELPGYLHHQELDYLYQQQRCYHYSSMPPPARPSCGASLAEGRAEPTPLRSCMSVSGSSSSSKNGRKRRRRQQVGFSPRSEVIVLPSAKDHEGDLARKWYDRAELAEFKAESRRVALSLSGTRTARLMKGLAYLAASGSSDGKGAAVDATTSASSSSSSLACIRGLEHLLCPTVARLLLHRRRVHVGRVLDEQRRLRAADAANEPRSWADELASVSMANSEFGKEWTRRVTVLHGDTSVLSLE